jgi:broad specificity phosphatase PhoE
LAQHLAAHDPAVVISSLEPKARETGEIAAGLMGIPFETAEGLHEQDRQGVGFLGSQEAFRAKVHGVLRQPDKLVFGNETGDEAHARFVQAVRDVLERRPDGNVAIVSHGTVMTLFVARAAGIEPVPLWQGLGMPSFVVLARPGFRLLGVAKDVSMPAR